MQRLWQLYLGKGTTNRSSLCHIHRKMFVNPELIPLLTPCTFLTPWNRTRWFWFNVTENSSVSVYKSWLAEEPRITFSFFKGKYSSKGNNPTARMVSEQTQLLPSYLWGADYWVRTDFQWRKWRVWSSVYSLTSLSFHSICRLNAVSHAALLYGVMLPDLPFLS